jgi:hypothetical protein
MQKYVWFPHDCVIIYILQYNELQSVAVNAENYGKVNNRKALTLDTFRAVVFYTIILYPATAIT